MYSRVTPDTGMNLKFPILVVLFPSILGPAFYFLGWFIYQFEDESIFINGKYVLIIFTFQYLLYNFFLDIPLMFLNYFLYKTCIEKNLTVNVIRFILGAPTFIYVILLFITLNVSFHTSY